MTPLFPRWSLGRAGRAAGTDAVPGRRSRELAEAIGRADAARDARQYREAAVLYRRVLQSMPSDAAIHTQCGHMFKEAGELGEAEGHYLEAARLTPGDPELALQLGHFYKVARRHGEAAAAYARAVELRPGWQEPREELSRLGPHLRAVGVPGSAADPAADAEPPGFEEEVASLRIAGAVTDLAPELAARPAGEMVELHEEGMLLRRCGKPERSRWGMLPTLRGVEAIRGLCNASAPLVELQISLDGMPVERSRLRGGYPLYLAPTQALIRKYVFNVWHDFSPYAWGRHEMELRFLDAQGRERVYREAVVIAAPLQEAEHPASDAVVTLPEGDARPVAEQIDARPSMTRPARRDIWLGPVRNALVLRTDQLGDMVTSIPAMRRLRALLPEARLVGLLTASNAALARTLDLFDEVITIDFPDDPSQRKRVMPLDAQQALRRRLESYGFDIAIDLAPASVSRPLLLLSGAPFLYGFHGEEFPWLTASFDLDTRETRNGREFLPHSSRLLAFVEALGAMLQTRATVIRRPDLARDRLLRYGIGAEDRFVVLHQGARIAFSRWPHFAILARLILERTNLKVVLLALAGDTAAVPDPDLHASSRVVLVDELLPFDDFDALISFAAAFVGNDSGPKHLAALRGVPVVAIHSARVNWGEWGQELVGTIVSRKVPCAGCQLYHDADECGRDFVCMTRITPHEVLEALVPLVS